MRKTFDVMVRIKKNKLHEICAFFEYFEGLTAIRTPAPETGKFANLHIMVAEDFKDEFKVLLERLKARIPWTLIN